MNIIEKTNEFIELIELDQATLRDMYTKYAMIADAYSGSSSKSIIVDNKKTYETILADNIVDYITYMYIGGSLGNELANSTNLGKILDSNSPIYLKKIIADLKSQGFDIKKNSSASNIKESLQYWGIAEADDLTNAEIIGNIEDDIPIKFDDIDMSDVIGTDDNNSEYNENISEDELEAALEEAAAELSEDEQERLDELDKVAKAAAAVGNIDIKDFSADNADAVREQIEKNDQAIANKLEAEKKEAEKAAVDKAVKEAVEGESDVDPVVIKNTINRIMAVYDVIYKPLFTSTPDGMLTDAGVVTLKSDNSLHIKAAGNKYATRLMSSIKGRYGRAIRELDYHEEVSLDCINPDGTLRYNYIPNFHVRNIYGVYRDKNGNLNKEKNWEKFRVHLVSMLTNVITKIFKKFKGDELRLSMSLVELFTTVIIAEEFDMEKSIKLTIKSMSLSNIKNSCETIGNMLANGEALPIDTTCVELINNSSESDGVHNILLVLDKKAYNSEIAFAYKPLRKILESGGKLGLKHTLLGRDVKGRDVTYNFESPQAVCSLVIAGSGSGKGVVTLNMLATFIAEGCPTVYVDWKPDMSAMLWDLERSTGARILSVDGLANRTEDSVPVRNYKLGMNAPSIPNVTDKLNVLSYVKMFQIMVACAQARNVGYNGLSYKGKKMQFIFDEAQAMNKVLNDLRASCEQFMKDNKPTKERPATDEFNYTKRLKQVLDSMFSGSTTFRNTTGRTGNVGLIMLGQQADCSAWANGAIKRDAIGFLVGNCSMKMLGKDATDGGKYSMNSCTPKGNDLLGNMGYFALIPQAVADKSAPDKIKVIKSYLVLNENDYAEPEPGRFTHGLLKNITDEVVKANIINNDLYNTDENGNRFINKQVGFQGLVEYIGQHIPNFNLNANLSAGYNEVEKLLTGLGIVGENGKYSCIEEYVYDCSYNSLFTGDEIRGLIVDGGTIDDLIESDDYSSSEEGGAGFEDDGDDLFNMQSQVDEADNGNGNTPNSGSMGSAGTGGSVADSILDGYTDNEPIIPREVQRVVERRQAQQAQNIDYGNSTFGNPEFERVEVDPEDYVAIEDDDGYIQVIKKPLTMPPNDQQMFSMGGTNGRKLFVTPDNVTEVLGLEQGNSILAVMNHTDTAEKFSGRLFKTLWGTQYEFKTRWKAILDAAAGRVNPDLIRRATITEDAVAFNKMKVATLGIVGGREDIRIEDIVNFQMTAKVFKNLSLLQIDETILEAAQIELGEPIEQLFKIFTKLQHLVVFEVGYGKVKSSISRNDIIQGRRNAKIQEMEERAKLKNQIEVVAAAKNKNLRDKSPGYQNKVWEASKSFQGQGWGAARDAIMDKNPKLFKAAGMSILTLGVLGVGAVFGVGGKIASLFRR